MKKHNALNLLVYISAALPAMAFAAPNDISLYGQIRMDYESARNDKGTAVNNQRLSSNASYFGVKGKEDLGDGLKAFFQIESQVDATGTGNNGLFNGIRNTGVGLEGGFGTVLMGAWDTPFKESHNKTELFGNATIFTGGNLIGRESISAANFITRQASVVQYWSPNFNGFQAKLSWTPGSDGIPAAAGLHVKKTATSLSAVYENDMLYAAYAHEARKDVKTTTTAGTYTAVANLTDTANRLVGAYKFKDGQVGLTYERLNVAKGVTSTATVSRNAWELSGKYKSGNNNFAALYANAGNLSDTADSGARQYTLRYGYTLSKRTELFGAYTRLSNDTSGKYDFSNNKIGPNAGSTLTGLGMGINHTF